jgi:hypothetical protein
MNSEQKEALILSIEHWEENLENAKNDLNINTGADDCECCRLFFDPFCKDCPIAQYVDNHCCDSTPYMNVIRADDEYGFMQTEETKMALIKTIEAEVKFLKEVLVNE